MDDTEKLSQMMIRCGLATGHGDTIDDLIFELEKQIKNTSHAFSDALKEIKPLQLQLKILQDDEMQHTKTIQNLSKMVARLDNSNLRGSLQFIAMANPLDGQTWEEHSREIKDYAIKELEWKEPE